MDRQSDRNFLFFNISVLEGNDCEDNPSYLCLAGFCSSDDTKQNCPKTCGSCPKPTEPTKSTKPTKPAKGKFL